MVTPKECLSKPERPKQLDQLYKRHCLPQHPHFLSCKWFNGSSSESSRGPFKSLNRPNIRHLPIQIWKNYNEEILILNQFRSTTTKFQQWRLKARSFLEVRDPITLTEATPRSSWWTTPIKCRWSPRFTETGQDPLRANQGLQPREVTFSEVN